MDITETLEAKSDQLNAVDLIGHERIIKVTNVIVTKSDQPVSVYFEGDNNRPWKPSKGMRRILAGAWGTDSSQWVGKSAMLYFEPTVKYAGKEVGGIRVKAMSDIDQRGLNFTIAINRTQREPYHVALLNTSRPAYPADAFSERLPVMIEKMQNGEMTLQSVIAQCQKTGDLSEEQIKQLQDAAPVEVPEDNDEHEENF